MVQPSEQRNTVWGASQKNSTIGVPVSSSHTLSGESKEADTAPAVRGNGHGPDPVGVAGQSVQLMARFQLPILA
jgi:hypothetical protein